jgi:hypothetical protein
LTMVGFWKVRRCQYSRARNATQLPCPSPTIKYTFHANKFRYESRRTISLFSHNHQVAQQRLASKFRSENQNKYPYRQTFKHSWPTPIDLFTVRSRPGRTGGMSDRAFGSGNACRDGSGALLAAGSCSVSGAISRENRYKHLHTTNVSRRPL